SWGFGRLRDFVFENKHTFFVAHDNIRKFFVRYETSDNLRADAAVIINELRYEIGVARLGTHEFEPVKHGGGGRVAVPRRSMSPKPLAGYDIHQTIAIHVHQCQGMALRKLDAARVGGAILV